MTYMCYTCNGEFETGYWLDTGETEDIFYCEHCADEAGISNSKHARRQFVEPKAWQLEDRQYISEATSFDQGNEFENEEQVRDYFTTDNMTTMFGECRYSKDDLERMADTVIENGWHMKVTTMTTAEKIARLLGDDGQTWETEDGRTLEKLAEEHGAVSTTHPDKHYLTRYRFDDGSAIVASEGAWDIEGKEPWSWTCED